MDQCAEKITFQRPSNFQKSGARWHFCMRWYKLVQILSQVCSDDNKACAEQHTGCMGAYLAVEVVDVDVRGDGHLTCGQGLEQAGLAAAVGAD